MYHFVYAKNLPYSLADVRKPVEGCRVCSEVQPNFCKPPSAQLIKATQSFERLSVDFKGPLPSSTKNRYLLTIVDEYSRFPFAFACASVDSKTVIAHFNQLLRCLVCLRTFIPIEGRLLRPMFLRQRGIACSRTSVYNAPGNGRCERYNGIIWTAVKLAIKCRKLDIARWECVLPDAFHSIRSLLCTATNATPHERLFHFTRRSTFDGVDSHLAECAWTCISEETFTFI